MDALSSPRTLTGEFIFFGKIVAVSIVGIHALGSCQDLSTYLSDEAERESAVASVFNQVQEKSVSQTLGKEFPYDTEKGVYTITPIGIAQTEDIKCLGYSATFQKQVGEDAIGKPKQLRTLFRNSEFQTCFDKLDTNPLPDDNIKQFSIGSDTHTRAYP